MKDKLLEKNVTSAQGFDYASCKPTEEDFRKIVELKIEYDENKNDADWRDNNPYKLPENYAKAFRSDAKLAIRRLISAIAVKFSELANALVERITSVFPYDKEDLKEIILTVSADNGNEIQELYNTIYVPATAKKPAAQTTATANQQTQQSTSATQNQQAGAPQFTNTPNITKKSKIYGGLYRVVAYDGNARRHIKFYKKENGKYKIRVDGAESTGWEYNDVAFDSEQQAENFLNYFVNGYADTKRDTTVYRFNITTEPIKIYNGNGGFTPVLDLSNYVLVDTDCGPAYICRQAVTCVESLKEDVEKHDELNDKIWGADKTIKQEVENKINDIVDEFISELEEDGIHIEVKDIVLIGSNASYNYTKDSDLDIHLIADTSTLNCPDNLYPALYGAYRSLFNKKLDINFYDIPVELFVETEDMPTVSNGIYSVKNKKWIKEPVKEDIPDVDKEALDKEVKKWSDRYEELTDDIEKYVSESLTEASNLSPLEKMKLFNAGARRENVKACGDGKLRDYWDICDIHQLNNAKSQIEAEMRRRGLNIPGSIHVQSQPQSQSPQNTTAPIKATLRINIDNLQSDELYYAVLKTEYTKLSTPIYADISNHMINLQSEADEAFAALLVAVSAKAKLATQICLGIVTKIGLGTTDDIRALIIEAAQNNRLTTLISNKLNELKEKDPSLFVESLYETINSSSVKSALAALIKDEWEAVGGYEDAIEKIESNGNFDDIINILNDIADEEEVHVGELQHCVDSIDDEVDDNILDGKEEAEEKTNSKKYELEEDSKHAGKFDIRNTNYKKAPAGQGKKYKPMLKQAFEQSYGLLKEIQNSLMIQESSSLIDLVLSHLVLHHLNQDHFDDRPENTFITSREMHDVLSRLPKVTDSSVKNREDYLRVLKAAYEQNMLSGRLVLYKLADMIRMTETGEFISPTTFEEVAGCLDSTVSEDWFDGWKEQATEANAPLSESLKSDRIDEIEAYINDIYQLRKEGLAKEGEYGIGNLTFKEIRNLGYLDNLKELKNKVLSKELSLNEEVSYTAKPLTDKQIYDYKNQIQRLVYSQPIIQRYGLFEIHNVKESDVQKTVSMLKRQAWITDITSSASGKFDFSRVDFRGTPARYFTIRGKIKAN